MYFHRFVRAVTSSKGRRKRAVCVVFYFIVLVFFITFSASSTSSSAPFYCCCGKLSVFCSVNLSFQCENLSVIFRVYSCCFFLHLSLPLRAFSPHTYVENVKTNYSDHLDFGCINFHPGLLLILYILILAKCSALCCVNAANVERGANFCFQK